MLPGLEIFHSTVSNILRTKNDAIVAVIHYALISNGFKCIGLNEKFEENSQDLKGSELLPANWNEKDFFVLRYVKPATKDLFLVKLIPSDSILLVNVLLKNKDLINAMTFDAAKYVTDDFKVFDNLFTNDESLQNLVNEFKKEILDKFENNNKEEEKKAKKSDEVKVSPLIEQPRTIWPPPVSRSIRPEPFPQIGHDDLNPFSRVGGGGMVLNPRDIPENFYRPNVPNLPLRPNIPGFPVPAYDPSSGLETRLPPGAVPPGANFEYFGPPQARRPGDPQNRRNHPDLDSDPSEFDFYN